MRAGMTGNGAESHGISQTDLNSSIKSAEVGLSPLQNG